MRYKDQKASGCLYTHLSEHLWYLHICAASMTLRSHSPLLLLLLSPPDLVPWKQQNNVYVCSLKICVSTISCSDRYLLAGMLACDIILWELYSYINLTHAHTHTHAQTHTHTRTHTHTHTHPMYKSLVCSGLWWWTNGAIIAYVCIAPLIHRLLYQLRNVDNLIQVGVQLVLVLWPPAEIVRHRWES